MPVLTFYHRPGCHLCTDMLALLQERQERLGFELEMVDVDSDPQLAARFGELVPLLSLGEREICHYFLDEAALKACLASV